MKKIWLIVGFVLALISSVLAYDLPDNFWRGLVAEAVGDGYSGMYAVATCVRNRLDKGMSTGLCGLDRKDLISFVTRQGKKYELMAKKIIKEVFEEKGVDTTGGAIYFENIKRYGKPKWCKVMTVKIKNHTFYKGE